MYDRIDTLKKLNVLFAEDDEYQQVMLERTLRLVFKNVFMAKDGEEAVEIFKNNKIHIVLLDYVMPMMNGYETSIEIRKINPKVPILFISGYSDKEKIINAINIKALDYIEKPVTQERFFKAVDKILDRMEQNGLLEKRVAPNIVYDFCEDKLLRDKKEILLTKQERVLFLLLIKNIGKAVSKKEAEEALSEYEVSENGLRNIIYRMRKKIGEDVIETIKDVGFVISEYK